MIIVLMGVTGSGKTTVGRLLAERLQWKFYEGDDFHPPGNIEKMIRGVPLEDQDREPWLEAIRNVITQAVARSENAVIACSALKASYRQFLQFRGEVVFVYLKADVALIKERLRYRTEHFMNPTLIESQFTSLEEPGDALQFDAALPTEEIVRSIRDQLSI
jgi:gluconokinase